MYDGFLKLERFRQPCHLQVCKRASYRRRPLGWASAPPIPGKDSRPPAARYNRK
ncbi:unnamed protein product, partial [Nesidiocoris tenuis]